LGEVVAIAARYYVTLSDHVAATGFEMDGSTAPDGTWEAHVARGWVPAGWGEASTLAFEDGSRLAGRCHDSRRVPVGNAELVGAATKRGIQLRQ
jgi:hypothetical protein